MKPEKTIDFHIRWTWHKIARMYNTEAIKNGFTMSIGYILLNIDTKLGTPSTKLAPKMGMEPRSLTRTLKGMQESGFIYRQPDKQDKRMVRIFLTDLGMEKRRVSRKTVIHFNEKLQSQISPEKLKIFFEVMEEFSQLIDQDEDGNAPKTNGAKVTNSNPVNT